MYDPAYSVTMTSSMQAPTPPASPPSYPQSAMTMRMSTASATGMLPASPLSYAGTAPSTRGSVASATALSPVLSRPYPQSATSHRGSVGSNAPTSPAPSNAAPADISSHRQHTNVVMEAVKVRARDEYQMQTMLHSAQLSSHIHNPEIEPEHTTNDLCDCAVHKYWKRKLERLDVQDTWSKAVIYPGEKPYHDFGHLRLFNNNPYSEVISPYGFIGTTITGAPRPEPVSHTTFLVQTTELDSDLNSKAQATVQAQEPAYNIWELEQLQSLVSNMSTEGHVTNGEINGNKQSKRTILRKALSVRTSDERTASKIKKKFSGGFELRDQILKEEQGRWEDESDTQIVAAYQRQVGIAQEIAEIRTHKPLQYLHLLRAGYFEPIPVAWEGQASSPLRFTIDGAAGWRGITPTWRGYTSTAEERLYWVLNLKAGSRVTLKPNMIKALELARARMASVVDTPPCYRSSSIAGHLQNPSQDYSKQVMLPFRVRNTPMLMTDDTMILLDASRSMDQNPLRPIYNQSLITGYTKASQPKSKGIMIIVLYMKSTIN